MNVVEPQRRGWLLRRLRWVYSELSRKLVVFRVDEPWNNIYHWGGSYQHVRSFSFVIVQMVLLIEYCLGRKIIAAVCLIVV